MPSQGPPPSVGGKDLSSFLPDESGSGGGTASLPNPAQMALFQENRERQARNAARAVRRQGGEDGVSDDEELGMLDGSDGASPGQLDSQEPSAMPAGMPSRPRTPEDDTDSLQLLRDVMKMTPNSRGIALKLWNAGVDKRSGAGPRAEATAGSGSKGSENALITIDSEIKTDLFAGRVVETPQELPALLRNGFHLPLSMCTSEVMTKMHKHPEQVQYRKMHDGKGIKRALIDIAQWPDEQMLKPEDWRDAWRNYFEILPAVCDDEIVKRFSEHYMWLSGQSDFNRIFPVILAFDIDVRRGYFLTKKTFVVDSKSYNDHFLKIRLEHIEKGTRSTLPIPAAPIAGSSQTLYRTPSHSPDSRRPRRDGTADSTAKPFREGRASASTSMLCLICGESGHRASQCGRSTLSNGKPAFTVWENKKLLAISTRAEICLTWNVQHADTSAPSAVPTVMPLRLSGASERERIITPYDADAFESILRTLGLLQRYPFLPRKLRYGFPIGDFAPLLRTFAPSNHSSGSEHIDFIRQYISEQVSLGRMTGPYSQAQVEHILGTFFVSSPLAVVPKAGSKKFRLVQNCSYQDEFGVSVNSQINSDDFPTKWGTAAEVAEIIVNAPSGAQAACLDIDSAFRNLPIKPAHKPFLVIQCDPGNFYIDHVLPFGVSSGTGVQGEPMDAIVNILGAHDIGPSRKWVDDLITFRFPVDQLATSDVRKYAYGLADIFRITDPLGVPWHQTKYSDYASRAVYSGFLWDLDQRSVALPDEKHSKYLAKLTAFIATAERGRVSQRDAMSINGTLSHITFVYPHGRAFLTNLCSFIASFSNPYAPRFAPHSVLSDMKWWFSVLNVPSIARSLASRGPLQDLGIWVDASSSWGIGIIVCGEWSAWHWQGPINTWKGQGRDIGWAEMVAVELAIRTVDALGYHDATILVRGDNKGVEGAFARGRSHNFQVNSSIRRAEVIAMSLNILFIVRYVNTKDNLADPVSRGDPTPSMSHRQPPFQLPEELVSFLVNV
ncbi:hypothetical protein SCP_0213520 [Sparassis crispa]|uniref:CCHC-type domain-containing protein n=1 Tax=Sparassis crispa TaxID=139825 RepID=A0A401GD85_9APHY|nr:hypothetical protein SCP_0213520 [Sparassis crispa]GBE80149.1 hypothetical protein SCP_0213520 [Sparassis crispa]